MHKTAISRNASQATISTLLYFILIVHSTIIKPLPLSFFELLFKSLFANVSRPSWPHTFGALFNNGEEKNSDENHIIMSVIPNLF